MLRQKYPAYCADNFKHRIGLLGYRAVQVLTGRHPRAVAEARRLRGKTISEVFGS